MNTTALYTSLLDLYEKGDEQELRAFLVAHVNEFPEEVKGEIGLFFFEEALRSHADGIDAETEFKSESIKALEALAGIRKTIEEQLAADLVRERLSKNAPQEPQG